MGLARDGVIGAGVAAVLLGAYVVAGPLNPPAGPVASTSPSLGDLQGQLAGAAGERADAKYADTSSDPGSAADGKPLTLQDMTAHEVRLEVVGLSISDWTIADFSRSVEVIAVSGLPGMPDTYRPGNPRYDLTLIRELPTSDTTIDEWYEEAAAGLPSAQRSGSVIFRQNGSELRRWNFFGGFVSDLDVRIVDGEAVEQLRLSVNLLRHAE